MKDKTEDDGQRTEPFKGTVVPQRWITVLTIFFSLFNAFSMRVCLSIAITRMVAQVDNEVKFADDTCPDHNNATMNARSFNSTSEADKLFDWSEYTQGVILSSFFWTYAVTNIVGGVIVQKLGGKHTLGFGILFTAILTLLTPMSIMWGDSTALICVRVLMGLGEGSTYPALNMLISQWIPPNERSKAGALAFAGAPFGTIFSMSISGLILQYVRNGWPFVFYFFGSVGVVAFLVNCAFCYNKPSENPFISDAEIKFLTESLKNTLTSPPPTPWRSMMTSKPVWALMTVTMGTVWAFTIITTDMPKYMSGVLKFSAKENGYFSSLPYLAMWSFSFIASFTADSIITKGRMSITRVRKIAVTLSVMGPGIFTVIASYAGCNGVLFVVLMTIGMAFKGCSYCSIMVNALDLAPNYAGALMGLVNGISTFSGIFSPYLVGILTPNQTIGEWRIIFWTIFIVCTVSNVVYLILGSGEVQDWNDPICSKREKQLDGKDPKEAIQLLSVK